MGLAAFPIFSLAALSPLVVTELGLTRTQLGVVSTTMFATGVAGSLLLGRLVDRVGARRVLVGLFVTSSVAVTLLATAGTFAALLATGVVVAVIALTATGAIAAIAAAPTVGPASLWVGALVLGGSVFGANVVGMTLIVRSVDVTRAGSATGALSTSMFTGFALGPVGFGALVDLTSSYRFVWSLVATTCAVAALVALRATLRGALWHEDAAVRS